VRVILFGSQARCAGAGSDLDFLVIEPDVPDRHAKMPIQRRTVPGLLPTLWAASATVSVGRSYALIPMERLERAAAPCDDTDDIYGLVQGAPR
jgi:hypothetical protein